MLLKNTYQGGTLTFLIYPTDEGTFVGACEELCIVKEAKDAELVKLQILRDARSYAGSIIEKKLGEELLNQHLPQEILDEFNSYRAKKQNESFQKWMEDIKKFMTDRIVT